MIRSNGGYLPPGTFIVTTLNSQLRLTVELNPYTTQFRKAIYVTGSHLRPSVFYWRSRTAYRPARRHLAVECTIRFRLRLSRSW